MEMSGKLTQFDGLNRIDGIFLSINIEGHNLFRCQIHTESGFLNRFRHETPTIEFSFYQKDSL